MSPRAMIPADTGVGASPASPNALGVMADGTPDSMDFIITPQICDDSPGLLNLLLHELVLFY